MNDSKDVANIEFSVHLTHNANIFILSKAVEIIFINAAQKKKKPTKMQKLHWQNRNILFQE